MLAGRGGGDGPSLVAIQVMDAPARQDAGQLGRGLARQRLADRPARGQAFPGNDLGHKIMVHTQGGQKVGQIHGLHYNCFAAIVLPLKKLFTLLYII